MFHGISELLRYRTLVRFMVMQDLTVRYRASFLGFLWTLLNPLLLMVVMYVVFSRFGRIQEDNYALFLFSGLMSWTFFSQSIERGQNSIVGNSALLQRIYLPKLVFPVAIVTSNLVNMFFFFIAYIIMALASGHGMPTTSWAVVPVLIILYLLGAGGAILMCSLNVFFRDFTHLTGVVLRALFYLTPIFYPPTVFGEKAQQFLALNPLYYPVVMVRDVIYYGKLPSTEFWLIGSATAVVVVLLGLIVFAATEDRFVYYAG